jgi:hypothetical protein
VLIENNCGAFYSGSWEKTDTIHYSAKENLHGGIIFQCDEKDCEWEGLLVECLKEVWDRR